MKILKYLFFLLLIIFIGGTIFFATKKGDYQIEQKQVIDAPPTVIFNQVNNYKTWEEWGSWKKDDPTMVFNYPEKTSGEGASYSWNGADEDGAMRTVEVIPDSSIKQELTIQTPLGERKSEVYWNFTPTDSSGTEVTWGITGKHPIMDKAYFTLFGYDFDGEIRKMYKRGLEGLDKRVKEEMEVYSVNVDGLTQHSGGFYMYTSTSTTLDGLSKAMDAMLPKVYNYMQDNNIAISSKPMTIYNQVDSTNDTAIISCGAMTSTRVIVPEDSTILCGFMPSQTVLKTVLKGNYKYIQQAYAKAYEYIQENKYTVNTESPYFEVYTTNPEEVPNPADWITEIYIPITIEADQNPVTEGSL